MYTVKASKSDCGRDSKKGRIVALGIPRDAKQEILGRLRIPKWK